MFIITLQKIEILHFNIFGANQKNSPKDKIRI